MALSKDIDSYSSHYQAIWEAALKTAAGLRLKYPSKKAAQRERMWLYGFKEAARHNQLPMAKHYATFQILLREENQQWTLYIIPRNQHEDVNAARASLAELGIDLDQAMAEIETEKLLGDTTLQEIGKKVSREIQQGSGNVFGNNDENT